MWKKHLAARLFVVWLLAVVPALGWHVAAAATTPITATIATNGPPIEPATGDVVGIAAPIIVRFAAPVGDRATAEQAIKITSSRQVTGSFSWENDSEAHWSPESFWPANTKVVVEAAGLKSRFQVGSALVAVANISTHEFTVSINGQVVRTMPTSLGKPGFETPTGTFPVIEKFRHMVMDSSTIGIPVNSPEGYKLDVDYATRITWGGIFVHGAPWSVGSQGYANVSHGCINLSNENAAWFFNNAKIGDPVVVTY